MGGIGPWTYPSKPPEEPFAYILDQEGIIFNPDSFWPFWHPKTAFNGQKSSPSGVRLAPDTHYQAWGQEYVLSSSQDCLKAGVSFQISLATPGRNPAHYAAALNVAHCHAEMDLQTFEISNLICDPTVETEARAKLQKVAEFFKYSQQQARAGVKRPETAYGRWHKQGEDGTGRLRAKAALATAQ